jgi:hypothetical protein
MSTQDFASLYTNGDVILQNPIESSSIFLIVVVVCGSIEYLFTLAEQVDSKFFRQMFETMSEEVLVVGVLSLMLTFGSSLINNLPEQWAVMFDWAHICLLFMGIMLVVLLCVVSARVFSGNQRWSKFEATRMTLTAASHSTSEKRYRAAAEKFTTALRAHDIHGDVSLAAYLLKSEKKILISLGNLTWKSWLALSTIVVFNALRTKLIPQSPSATELNNVLDDTGNLINIASFVLVCGYGTLGLYLEIDRRLKLRFQQYVLLSAGGAANDEGRANAAGDDAAAPLVLRKVDLDDPQSFLLWQSLGNTVSMIQAVLMFLVWYASVFCLSMMYRSFLYDFGLTLLILCLAAAPVVVFVVMVPWTLTIVAILSSLGSSLREDWARGLVASVAVDRRGVDDEATDKKEVAAVTRVALRPIVLETAELQRQFEASRRQADQDDEYL